ncbi:hypothetical protein FHG66_04370 [Rubellimicrobium rubrum]|uniref:Nuclear transport factor 2 family protein n=1 Tax=Rubellimicrobium rubrum TaxID=2585369 RepID=A0A5C4N5W4_9RHOB|nr:hypothetical protein FHG66_04370 [Rubellimicrobium rubrum]
MAAASIRPLAVTPLFVRLGELFVKGRLDEMSRHFAFPCPIEIEGGLVVIRTPKVLEAFLATRRSSALLAGMTQMTPRIAAIEMPRKGRFRVWLRWEYIFEDVCLPDEYGSVYYLAQKPWGELMIEMVDSVRVPPYAAQAQSA